MSVMESKDIYKADEWMTAAEFWELFGYLGDISDSDDFNWKFLTFINDLLFSIFVNKYDFLFRGIICGIARGICVLHISQCYRKLDYL